MPILGAESQAETLDAGPHTVADPLTPYDTVLRQQMSLFTTPTLPGEGVFRDTAFGENKHLPVHRWVPWIAGYSAVFVDDVISTYVPHKKTALILDPFCGGGTTLLQAALRGHHAVGFDLNPYPVLAAHAKLSALTIDLSTFDATLEAMQAHAGTWKAAALPPETQPPPLKSRLPFFSPQVEEQVLYALDFIKAIALEPIARLYRMAFGAVMVSFSNYSYEL